MNASSIQQFFFSEEFALRIAVPTAFGCLISHFYPISFQATVLVGAIFSGSVALALVAFDVEEGIEKIAIILAFLAITYFGIVGFIKPLNDYFAIALTPKLIAKILVFNLLGQGVIFGVSTHDYPSITEVENFNKTQLQSLYGTFGVSTHDYPSITEVENFNKTQLQLLRGTFQISTHDYPSITEVENFNKTQLQSLYGTFEKNSKLYHQYLFANQVVLDKCFYETLGLVLPFSSSKFTLKKIPQISIESTEILYKLCDPKKNYWNRFSFIKKVILNKYFFDNLGCFYFEPFNLKASKEISESEFDYKILKILHELNLLPYRGMFPEHFTSALSQAAPRIAVENYETYIWYRLLKKLYTGATEGRLALLVPTHDFTLLTERCEKVEEKAARLKSSFRNHQKNSHEYNLENLALLNKYAGELFHYDFVPFLKNAVTCDSISKASEETIRRLYAVCNRYPIHLTYFDKKIVDLLNKRFESPPDLKMVDFEILHRETKKICLETKIKYLPRHVAEGYRVWFIRYPQTWERVLPENKTLINECFKNYNLFTL